MLLIVFCFWKDNGTSKGSLNTKIGVQAARCLALLGCVYLFYVVGGVELQKLVSEEYLLKVLEERTERFARPFPIDHQHESLNALVASGPLKLFYNLFYPFPLTGGIEKYLIPKLDVVFNAIILFSLAILAVTFIRIRKSMKINGIDDYYMLIYGRNISRVIFMCFLSLQLYALFEIQFGGAMRHRLPFVLIILVCIVLCFSLVSRYKLLNYSNGY